MGDWLGIADRSPQPGGVTLNKSLPPRAVWHITWDALGPGGIQPPFPNVAKYLKDKGYCPTLMWNPFTGYVEQYYPASVGGRALAAWNEDGVVNIQIEVFFSPGCVVDGVKYNTVAETPCVNLDKILDWIDSFGIPREWPMGEPQWKNNSRDTDIWNTKAGHYGHCNVPDNTHTDPGPMPSIAGFNYDSVVIESTEEVDDDMALSPENQKKLDMIPMVVEMLNNIAGGINNVPKAVLDEEVDSTVGGKSSLRTVVKWAAADFAAANDDKNQ